MSALPDYARLRDAGTAFAPTPPPASLPPAPNEVIAMGREFLSEFHRAALELVMAGRAGAQGREHLGMVQAFAAGRRCSRLQAMVPSERPLGLGARPFRVAPLLFAYAGTLIDAT